LAGEFDATLGTEIDKLSQFEIEELAFLILSQLRAKSASAS